MSTGNASGGEARTIKASEFKAKCLALMDEVAESGEEIVITKRGTPVARLVSCREQSRRRTLARAGRSSSTATSPSPIDVQWEAEQGLLDGT